LFVDERISRTKKKINNKNSSNGNIIQIKHFIEFLVFYCIFSILGRVLQEIERFKEQGMRD